MAHEVETMAYANAVPWHGLGARVDQDVSVQEMLEAAGLNWELKQVPLQVAPSDRTPEAMVGLPVLERSAWVRDTDNKVMAVAGPAWRPLQPAKTIEFMRNYVASGNATLETAGSLRGGKLVWGLAKLNHNFEVRAGDHVNGYLLITSPNEVGKAITVRTTTVRVVCANTMALAMAGGNGETHYRQTHMSDFDEEAAKAVVGNAHEQLAQAERNAKILDKLKLSASDAITKVLAPVFFPSTLKDKELMEEIQTPEGMPKRLLEIMTSIESSPGNAEIAGTGWAVLNGVTHWADHVYGRSAASRMDRAWMGDNARHKLAVEQKLLELAS